MIYLDSSGIVKFLKREPESLAVRTWRSELDPGVELVTSQLASLEISRALLRAGEPSDRVPYLVGQALRGLYLVDLTSTVLARARSYGMRRLGALDSIHLATADPFRPELEALVTYDTELASAASELGMVIVTPG